MEKTELIVKCTDNCSCLSIDKFDSEPLYFITTYKSYATKSWRDKWIDIWGIILGHNIVDTEIVLSEHEFNKLKNYK